MSNYKKRYTIGAVFSPELDLVLLIEKQKPDWQRGKLNLPAAISRKGKLPRLAFAESFRKKLALTLQTGNMLGALTTRITITWICSPQYFLMDKPRKGLRRRRLNGTKYTTSRQNVSATSFGLSPSRPTPLSRATATISPSAFSPINIPTHDR